MELDLDPASPVPIYLQIVEQVRRLIAVGALRPGDRLATVRELAIQCRVNRNTAARAFQELERDGIVTTRVGLGTFVAEDGPVMDSIERDAILDAQIDRILVEAHSLGVPMEQIPSRLWRRIEVFKKERAAGGLARAALQGPFSPERGSSAGPGSATKATRTVTSSDPARSVTLGESTPTKTTAKTPEEEPSSTPGDGDTAPGPHHRQEGDS